MNNLENFIKFKKGTIPLIISVPHGGILECKNIPKRNKGVLGVDKATIELAEKLIEYFKEISKTKTSISKAPSYIISKVRRSKIDLNRDEKEAYIQTSLLAREIYRFYHNKINEFIAENLKTFKHSLLIDVHGFEKHKRPEGFRDVELVLGTNNLTSLFSEPVPKRLKDQNIRGKIIKKFLELDIPIAPGHPKRREYILNGGYITQKYGASEYLGSQAIQIEFSDIIRIHDKKLRNKILFTLAKVILNYIL